MSNQQIAIFKRAQSERRGEFSSSATVLAVNRMMMALEFMFGCWHRNLSRPFTLSGWTYEVCLNCGRKFAYDRAEIGCYAIHHDHSQVQDA